MSQSRRGILFAGAALGVMGGVLAACDSSTPVDNGTGAGSGSGGTNTSAGGDTGAGNATSGNTTGGNTTGGGGNTTGGGGNNTGGGGGTLPPSTGRVRYDVSSAEGQQMLAVYARAVGLMMNLPDSDPRSWTFQWYSHWVKGPQDLSGKAAEMSRVFGSASSPARSLAQKMWSGCQAHGENQDESFFLPWHRMFVLAFENIVRSVAGEPSFTLPYWNYMDPGQRSVPSQFRRPGDPVWGSLYRSTRKAAVNSGGPIADPSDLNPDILAETSYAPLGADQGFCANLDGGIHGNVHVGVGNATTGMGAVPWAAGDPIFWLHHCNIDRLWASWNRAGNANPSDVDFTSKPFVFAGPTGAQISYTVSQMLSLSQAGYSYDALIGEDGQPIPQVAALAAPVGKAREAFRLPFVDVANAATTDGRPEVGRPTPVLRALPTISHVAEGVRLGGGGLIRVRLASTQATPEVATRALATLVAPPARMQRKSAMAAAPPPSSKLFAFLAPKKPAPAFATAPPPAPPAPPPAVAAPKPGQKVFLVLGSITTDIQPGVVYRVYLEAPRKTGAVEPFQVGTVSFFSAMGGMSGMKMAGKSRSFDITALADTLAKQGRLEANPAVTFVPVGAPVTEAQPVIGSVSLAIQ